jgi:hypothetical protein
MVTEAEAEAVVCRLAFETLTVRDGGGVRVEATAVADRACDDEAAIGGIVTSAVATPEVCSCPFPTLTVRDGGGVLVTALGVVDRAVDTLAVSDTSDALGSMRWWSRIITR